MNQSISLARYGLAYTFWVITVALAFVALLVWRSTAMIALGMTSWDRYLEHAINQFGFLILAIVGLCVIIFAEFYYRTGVEKKQLLQRFSLITAIEVLIVSIAHLVQWIGGIVLSLPISPIFFIVELAISVLFFVLYRRSKTEALPVVL